MPTCSVCSQNLTQTSTDPPEPTRTFGSGIAPGDDQRRAGSSHRLQVMTMTGLWACLSTRSLTLPSISDFILDSPLLPITTRMA